MMPTPLELHTLPAPSPATLAKAAAGALATAAVILITIVLPAEYAIDPLGTGKRLGLTDIAAPAAPASELATSPESALLAPLARGPIGEYPREYQVDAFEIALAPKESVEYKYHLERGATMLYSWTATAPVVQDFHAERSGRLTEGGSGEESFDKQVRRQATGSFTAPFAGIHGWFWENAGTEAVTIRLTSAGFYSSAVKIRSDGTRELQQLRPPGSLTPQKIRP